MPEIKIGDSVKVRGWPGIAFTFRGHPLIHCLDEDGVYPEKLEDPDRAIVVMVGDDRKWNVEMDDLTLLPPEKFCGVCGQIGCLHGAE